MKLMTQAQIWFLVAASAGLCPGAWTSARAERISHDSGGLRPVDLRTEYRSNPLGIDVLSPRLSWVLVAAQGARGQHQTAYRILVASSPDRLQEQSADLWDSGKVHSDASIHVSYEGEALRSGQRAFWTVRVWDRDGRPSPYSEPAWWEMGLLSAGDWQGSWIKGARPAPETEEEWYDENPAPLLRSAFFVEDKPVARARVYVSGLGYYELNLNGRRVGDHVLDPPWTNYAKRVYYSVYDITRLLNEGENVLGVMLGNGWYNPLPMKIFGRWQLREHLPVGDPKVLLQLNIEFEDGSSQSVFTDTDWRTNDGPIIKNNIYLGEVYDARREQDGWDRAGFDDGHWVPALPEAPPGGTLRALDLPPVRIMRSFKPVSVHEQAPGVYIFDMGRNFAGWVTLRVSGAASDSVVLRFGELLHDTGEINVLTSTMTQIKDWAAISDRDWQRVLSGPFWNKGPYRPVTAWQSNTYILKGEGVEEYTPRFTWHGFRYVEVRGFPGEPALDALTGHLLYSAVDTAGSFSSSNELFARIQEATMWSMHSNMFSIQSDCPHRERFAYGGDIVAASEMAMLNLDMPAFYTKTVRDFADAVRPNGGFTEIAPDVGIDVEGLGGGAGPVGWGTAHPMLVWQLHQYYGERRLMEEQYDAVKRWVDFLAENAEDHILDNGISDHASLAPRPRALTGTAFFYYNVDLLLRMARVLNRPDDVRAYEPLAARIKEAFNRRFLDPETGRYGEATQASQAFPLYMGLVPGEHRAAALQVLVDSIMIGHGGHLSTGIFGTKYMLDVLSREGFAEVAYTVANQRDFPGWGYMIESGATTLWEYWAFSEHVESHNHPMFGSVSEWFFKHLAGIQPDPEAVGFDRIIIRPNVVRDLTWAGARYRSIRGPIGSAWRINGNTFEMEVEIPVSATATVFVPARRIEDVLEGGRPVGESAGVAFIRLDDGAAVFRVESGNYRFSVGDFD